MRSYSSYWASYKKRIRPAALKKAGDASTCIEKAWTSAKAILGQSQQDQGDDPFPFKKLLVPKYKAAKIRLGLQHASTSFAVSPQLDLEGFSFRMEFNPQRLGKTGLEDIEGVFHELFEERFSFDAWLANASAPAADIAFDIINVGIQDVLLRSDLGKKWSGYFGELIRSLESPSF